MVELSPAFSPDLELEGPSWRRKLMLPLGLGVLIAAGAAGYWWFVRDDSAPVAVAQQQTAQATTGQLVSSLSSTGTAAASLTSKLTFQSAAKVTAVNAKLGDKVEAGQVLATLDAADAKRKVESAQASLTAAQLRLADLLEPSTASALASAQAAISTAQVQLANAQEALRKAQAGPDSDAVATADSAVTQVEQGVTSAQNQQQSAWIALLTAQRNYCTTDNRLVQVCWESDLPLSQARVDALIAEIRNPATNAVATSAQSLITANTSYGNAITGVTNAQKSLQTAKDKRKALNDPPTPLTLQQLQSAIENANAQVLSAQQKYVDLLRGPAATDVASQQQAVRTAQDAYDTAKSNLDAVVLKAPFDGTVTAVGVNVGDNVTAATAAFTITNEDVIRVDLSVPESEFVGLKAGQYGMATFESLPGHTYAVRVTAVNPTPTTNQGVVSYQVQAEILRPDQLQDAATAQGVTQALAAVNGGGTFRGPAANGGTGATNGTGGAGATNGPQGGTAGNAPPGAVQTARAGGGRPTGQAPFSGTPPAGANGPQGGGNAGGTAAGGATNLLQGLLNAPMPTPGMTASVTIVKSIEQNVLLVPSNAIRTRGQQKYVLVKKDDGTTEERVIQTGSSNSSQVAIASGLNEGETVVLGSSSAATSTNAGNPQGNQQGGFFIGGGPGGATNNGGGIGGNGGTGGVR